LRLYNSFESNRKHSTSKIIIDQIIRGNLNPGDKLPTERKLLKLSGFSRTTIREIIKAFDVIKKL